MHQNGRISLQRKSVVDEVWTAHRLSQKTVDNTLGAMVAKRELVIPLRGRFELAPSTLQRLGSNKDLYLEGSNRERKLSDSEVLQVPDNVPTSFNGNSGISQGKTSGTCQIPFAAADPLDLLLVIQTLAY